MTKIIGGDDARELAESLRRLLAEAGNSTANRVSALFNSPAQLVAQLLDRLRAADARGSVDSAVAVDTASDNAAQISGRAVVALERFGAGGPFVVQHVSRDTDRIAR